MDWRLGHLRAPRARADDQRQLVLAILADIYDRSLPSRIFVAVSRGNTACIPVLLPGKQGAKGTKDRSEQIKGAARFVKRVSLRISPNLVERRHELEGF